MNIRAILQRLTGNKSSFEANRCPGEPAILAYAGGGLAETDRTTLQTHFAKCDDCRELLVGTAQTPDTTNVELVSDKEVKQQAARVHAYIELDESKRRRSNKETTKRREPARSGLYLSYPRLASAALVVSAVAAGSVMWITSDQGSDKTAAMATLRQAMKDERRNQALISGDLPYSPYSPKRGEEESDDLNYERALNRVKSAENENAPVEVRHTFARILLAMGGRENVRKALTILDQIEATGVQTPELLNDLGVARLQLGDYDAAANYFTRALEKSPGAGVSLFNKALSEQKAGRVDEAKHDWNQFISASSDQRLKAEARSQLDVLR